MTGNLAGRVRRVERVEDAADLLRLRTTERPAGLPATPLEAWGEDDLVKLRASVAAAKATGARRPLGWMSTADLLALRDRMEGVHHA